MIRGFEKISKYEKEDLQMPIRKTKFSAGYDIAVSETVVIQPLSKILHELLAKVQDKISQEQIDKMDSLNETDPLAAAKYYVSLVTLDLDSIKKVMKETGFKPTLLPTGIKAYMQQDEVLKLFIRSSAPLNSFIIMANSTGIIDSDYYNNSDNEGHIFFQVINLSPVPLIINKGDIIGQGVFEKYLITDDDDKQEKQDREGGFGSTSVK